MKEIFSLLNIKHLNDEIYDRYQNFIDKIVRSEVEFSINTYIEYEKQHSIMDYGYI